MDYKCYLCSNFFSNIDDAVKHLKSVHKQKEKVDTFQCLNVNGCSKGFLHISSLKTHMKKWYIL